MNITPTAAVVLPLAAIAALRRRWLLAFLVATAPFYSLIVVTFLSHEFRPSEIALLLLISRQVISWLNQRQLVIRSWDTSRWLILFGSVCLLSVIAATLYLPDVLVHPYNIGGFGSFAFRPVGFTSENITQLLLRLFFVVGVFAIADAIKSVAEIRRLLRWFVLTGVLVGAVGLIYQFSVLVGLPVESPLSWIGFDRFINNPARVGPLPRMYSLPGEPGFTGDYLLYAFAISVTGLIANKYNVFTWKENGFVTAFLAVSILFSTGTTAYGGLVILGSILIGAAFVFEKLRTPTFKGILASGVMAIPIGFVLDSILFNGTLRNLLWYEIQKLTFSAGSGNIRLRYMARTLDVIEARPLLGVGVGSHHVPSLLFTLAAEVGLIGLTTFIVIHLVLYRHCGWLAYQNQAPYNALALPLFISGITLILTNLIAKSIAALLFPWYWFSLAFPLALIAVWQTDKRDENVDTHQKIVSN